MGNQNSGNRSGKPRAPGAGRPPQTATLKLDARVGFTRRLKDGGVVPVESGHVASIGRGSPRAITITLDNGDTLVIWL